MSYRGMYKSGVKTVEFSSPAEFKMFKFLSIIILFAHLGYLQAQYFQSDSLDSNIVERHLSTNASYRIKICSGGIRCKERVNSINLRERFSPAYDIWPLTLQNVTCLYCYNSLNEKFCMDQTKQKTLFFTTKSNSQECFSEQRYYELTIGCTCSSHIVLNETASETNLLRMWQNENNWENSQPF